MTDKQFLSVVRDCQSAWLYRWWEIYKRTLVEQMAEDVEAISADR